MTDPSRKPVLVVDDDEADLLMYERALTGTRFQVIPARSAAAATKTLDLVRPAAMVLDITAARRAIVGVDRAPETSTVRHRISR